MPSFGVIATRLLRVFERAGILLAPPDVWRGEVSVRLLEDGGD